MPIVDPNREKVLDCPRCWVKMERREVEIPGPNIDIDECPRCGGVWLDRGELRKVTGNRDLSNYLTKHIGTKTESQTVCPRCGSLMDLELADDVEVDVCLNCRGVWLDPGELDELKAKEGFEGDTEAKAIELEEEREMMAKRTALQRFLYKLRQ